MNQSSAAPSSSRSQLLPGSMALSWSRHMRILTQDEVPEAKQTLNLGLQRFQLNLGLVSCTDLIH